MSNVPPGGGFPPPPSGPPPGGGYPPPPGGGDYPPPGGGGFPPPPGGGAYPPPPGGFGGFQGGGGQGQLAEWQDRLVSGLIDWLGPMILANILANIVGAIISTNSNLWFNPTGIVFSLLAVAWALYQGYLAGETGQSMGMKQSGLRLVGEQTGQPIGGSQGVVRNVLFLANAICCPIWPVVIIDSLFPLWDSKKQTLRDKIAKAVVVKA